MTFIITENEELEPTLYQSDDMGIFYRTEEASPQKIADLKNFMMGWLQNIKYQDYELIKEESFEQEDFEL